MTYSEKLQDRRWQEKRNLILARDKYKCRACCDAEDTSQLHVHHRYYKFRTDPWDYPDEALITLCKGCHAAATDYNGVFDSTLKTYFGPDELLDVASLFNQFEQCGIPPHILLYAFQELICDGDAFCALIKSQLSMAEARGSTNKVSAIKCWLYLMGKGEA